MIQGVFFDLDGTLADTAPDLAAALNATLAHFGRPALAFETIRPVVSHGARAMLELAFGLRPGQAGYDAARQYFLAHYRRHIAHQTRLFEGMPELLQRLEEHGLKWGVVTNKPAWLTEPLLAELGLDQRAASIVSGDTTARSKPHPQPLQHACEEAGVTARHCVYVGDAQRDIEAGRAAGMKTLAAAFGYLLPGEDPQQWQADALIDHPLAAWDHIRHWNRP